MAKRISVFEAPRETMRAAGPGRVTSVPNPSVRWIDGETVAVAVGDGSAAVRVGTGVDSAGRAHPAASAAKSNETRIAYRILFMVSPKEK
jgi:hypothetical protein